jgi:hypothetical protein
VRRYTEASQFNLFELNCEGQKLTDVIKFSEGPKDVGRKGIEAGGKVMCMYEDVCLFIATDKVRARGKI